MLYTVKEVAKLSGVTIKALHHYHKIGLLQPYEITDAGYRLYGTKELERLQQILFYRELDFSLTDIKKTLEDEPNRLVCLAKYQELFYERRQRMDCLLNTIEESILLTKKGEIMDKSTMFKGLNKEEWGNALSDQNKHLKNKYGYEVPEVQEDQVDSMNDQSMEAKEFMDHITSALKSGWKANDERVQKLIGKHIVFLNKYGNSINANLLVDQTKFFLDDDFHRNMLENQQIGLAYYLCIAAEMYASSN